MLQEAGEPHDSSSGWSHSKCEFLFLVETSRKFITENIYHQKAMKFIEIHTEGKSEPKEKNKEKEASCYNFMAVFY